MESPVNLWIRADLETFNSDTLALIPQGQQQEYIALMKELHHSKSIVALAIERMYMFEQERAAFFEPFINTGGREISGPTEKEAEASNSPNVGGSAPDYTPVTDLNEYRNRRG